MPERIYRPEFCCLGCGKDSEKYPDKYDRKECDDHRIARDNRQDGELVQERYDEKTSSYPYHSGKDTDNNGLCEKLHEDVLACRTDGFSDSDFFRAFGDRYEHNVHNSDTSDQKRYGRDTS